MKVYAASCDCGFTGSYSSAARAQQALSYHSCARWRRHFASVHAGDPVDRTPRPCTHPHATHTHGTYACYTADRCRCYPCQWAKSVYETDRSRRHATGTFGNDWVDARPVRRHVRDVLLPSGMGLKRIAALSGVSHGALTKLMYGARRPDTGRIRKTRRVARATADRLFALTPHNVAAGARVSSVGTRRRIQALCWVGWTVQAQADHMGVDRQGLDRALRGKHVLRTTADTVAAMFEQMVLTPPPADTSRHQAWVSAARRRARAHGWAPPGAWDEDTIDDPHALPDYGPAVPTRPGPRSRLPDPDNLARQVNADGIGAVAARHHLTRDAIWVRLHRAGYRADQRGDAVHYRKADAA